MLGQSIPKAQCVNIVYKSGTHTQHLHSLSRDKFCGVKKGKINWIRCNLSYQFDQKKPFYSVYGAIGLFLFNLGVQDVNIQVVVAVGAKHLNLCTYLYGNVYVGLVGECMCLYRYLDKFFLCYETVFRNGCMLFRSMYETRAFFCPFLWSMLSIYLSVWIPIEFCSGCFFSRFH